MLLLALTTLLSCSDKGNFFYQEAAGPRIISFGFYQEDNPNTLSKDYVADLSSAPSLGTATVNVALPMPSTVDKSALIARFTTTDGTTIRVNGIDQQSQTTVNDFTIPIDYIVGKDGINVRYAVTITKATGMKWTELPAFTALTTYGTPVLLINPETNLPCIGFKVRSNSDYRPVAIHYTPEGWKYFGDGPFGDEISGSYYDMTLDKAGNPFFAYSNNTDNVALKGSLSVQDYSADSWQFTGGTAAVLKAQSQYIGIEYLANGEVICVQKNNSAKADYGRNKLVTSIYKGGTWTSQTPPMLANDVYQCSMAAGSDAAYVAVINRGSVDGVAYGYNVLKYQDGIWTAMTLNHLEPGNTFNNIYIIGAYVDPNQIPYIWTVDNASGETAIRVKYYQKERDEWVDLGGNVLPLGIPFDRHIELSMAVTADGTPYIAFTNTADQSYPYLMFLDQDTQQWSKPTKICDIAASGLRLAFSHNGVGYVSFSDASQGLHVFKYE